MGTGIDMARDQAPVHAQVLDDFKDQLLIALVQRLGGVDGLVQIPVSEVDGTGQFILLMSVENSTFNFEVRKKQ
ncbi:hypothetical protein ACMYR3_06265 [Ampullimonas aquatilis]|uniref:hypothetical protein n=1 Tax=Ampullimonas aquatilis TaxID=1341549 RepID=UPI003C762FDD